jgi:protein phosphatase
MVWQHEQELRLVEILYGGKTDVGMVRSNNEDNFSIDEELGLFIVADGMGGHASGEIASEMAVEIINKNYQQTLKGKTQTLVGPYDHTLSPATNRLLSSARIANRAIFEAAQKTDKYHKMGTTLVALLLQERTAILASVGDSRIYRIRKGSIEQLTQDHSLVNQQLKLGLITEEEARTSKAKNIITRAFGLRRNVPIDVNEQMIQEDDRFVLCSDGLTDLIKDDEILNMVLNNTGELSEACDRLIQMAKQKGGHDNITVILVHLRNVRSLGGRLSRWLLPSKKKFMRS